MFCERIPMTTYAKEGEPQAYANTDKEIYRGPSRCEFGDKDRFYADSLHITKDGALGINCGGHVRVLPIREWHKLGTESRPDTVRDIEGIVNRVLDMAIRFICVEGTLGNKERAAVLAVIKEGFK